jgi:hypothetical protein
LAWIACRDTGFEVGALSISEFISQVGMFTFGMAFAAGLVFFMYCRDAWRWRMLAQHYARPWARPHDVRTMHVLYGHGALNSYHGLLKIGLHQNGVSLAIIPPFSFFYFCEPLFIPYSEIKGWQQHWYLGAKSVELEFPRMLEIEMVMPADQVEWIRNRSGLQMTVKAEPTPHRAKPVLWYYVTIANAGLALGLAVWLLVDGKVTLF